MMAYHSMFNVFFISLAVCSFVSQSSLLTVESVNLVVAHYGFFCITVATEVLFEQFLICTAM